MAGPYTTNKGKNVITDRLQTTPATYTSSGPRFVAFGAGTGVAQSEITFPLRSVENLLVRKAL